jgi:tRNA (guanine-N7-)-methyltransferase
MPRVRVHQHVNPLAPRFQQPAPPVNFAGVFADPGLPLHLDIGCARGRFLLKMAQLESNRNFLGLEIREPLVEEANRIKNEKSLTNLHYEFCNATISLGNVLKELEPGILQMVTIQFPDPWFKKRHFKRRMVKIGLVADIAAHLLPGGKVFIQSDVAEVAEEICGFFAENPAFKKVESKTLTTNPFPVKTEREGAVEERGLPVYRSMFVKKI